MDRSCFPSATFSITPSIIRSTRTRGTRPRVDQIRAGLSLLELILALGLAGLIMYAVAMAIDLHLRALDVRRSNVEEAQIARATLQLIANDLRSAVRQYKVDMSSIEQLAMASLANAAGASSGDSSGGGNGSGQDGGGNAGSPPNNSGSGSGSGGGGNASGTSGGSSDSGSGSGMDSIDTISEDGSTANTVDLASSLVVPPVPGLYGNQYELQIDISRLPRPDQYQVMTTSNPAALPNIPSDIKTVTYYVQMGAAGTSNMVTDPLATGAQALQPATGLVRREVDRAVLQHAVERGASDQLMRTGDLLAREVVSIEFQYFDGTTWLTAWDSEQMGGLPLAVEIRLAVQRQVPETSTIFFGASSAAVSAPVVYRLVVHLPLGELPPVEDMLEDGGLENLGL